MSFSQNTALDEPTLAYQVARFAVSCLKGAVPDEVRRSARQCVVDSVGIAVAASTLDTSAAIIGYATEQGGKPEATAIGAPSRLPAALAALVNGTLAHSLDYDDTHLPSVVHPSATVVPACWRRLRPTTPLAVDGGCRCRRPRNLFPAGHGRLRSRRS